MTTPAPPSPVEADPQIGPLVQSFLACVCAELHASGRPVCECCLVWGDSIPPADFCDCDCAGGHGQAWVRVVRLDPAATGNRTAAMKCQPIRLRVWLEAGVYRCVPAVGADGTSPPSCDDRSDSAWGFIQDARSLRRAVACCEALKDRRVEFMSQEPTGVRGGCSGLTTQFTIDL